jgi:hypothetical protein
VSELEDEVSWPLLLRTGFGNVFPYGRWDQDSTVLIAEAINDDVWDLVVEYARFAPWDATTAC